MTFTVRATPHLNRCTAASSRRPAAATFAWTACKDRATAPHFPQRDHHPITIMSPAHRTSGSWTKISMGARAHTNAIAPARRLSSAPRSPLRGALRGDRAPPPALHHNEWSEDKPQDHIVNNLTTPGRLDKGRPHR